MRAEDTLQYLFDFWGNTNPTRKIALNTLFCTVGNGRKWKDGEIVSEYDDCMYLDRWQLKEPIKHATPEPHLKEIYNIHKSFVPEDNEWYPLSEYSLLSKLPDNIKDDWLNLAIECVDLMKEDGIDIPDNIEQRIKQLSQKKFKEVNNE